jgi:hypothetical protein
MIGLVTAEAQKRQRDMDHMVADEVYGEGEHEGEPDKTADVTTRYDGGVPKAHVDGPTAGAIPEPESDSGEALHTTGEGVKPMAASRFTRTGDVPGLARPSPANKVHWFGPKVTEVSQDQIRGAS